MGSFEISSVGKEEKPSLDLKWFEMEARKVNFFGKKKKKVGIRSG